MTIPSSTDVAAVSCTGVSYHFGKRVAVDHIDLDVRPGEIFGLLGPNGAGKTTTIRMLVTILKPAAGNISLFGIDVVAHPIRARKVLGYVPQGLSADSSLTGRENVSLFARLFDMPRAGRRKQVAEVLEIMGLADSADRLTSTYSGGMIRRLELAQALVSKPRLLVLDEPTVGLDPIARDEVWEQVQHLREEHGLTVLLTTHYMEEADALCDRVALMHQAQVRVLGSPTELKDQLGPEATLNEVFRHFTGDALGHPNSGGDYADVRRARRTANRLG